jgi:hypothetical protein
MDDGGQWLFLFQMEQKASEFERVLVSCLRLLS